MEPGKKATEGRSQLPLLLGLAIVLSGLALWDRRANWSTEEVRVPAAAMPDAARAAPAEPVDTGMDIAPERAEDSHPLAGLALSELRDTVGRPLFERSRRPVEPPRAPTPVAVQAPAPPPPRRMADPNALTLLGVLMREGEGQGGAIALVRRNQTGQNMRLQEGETVDGWTIDRIEPESVVLRQGDTKIALQLFRKR
jgi:hypothetical protein